MLPLLAAAALFTAQAAEGNGRAGVAFPGAADTDHFTVEASVGTGLVVPEDADGNIVDPLWSSSADLVWAPGDHATIELRAVGGPEHLVTFGGARTVVVRNQHWAFAPWAGAIFLGPAENTGWDLVPVVGAAVDYRSEHFGFDLSLPLVAVRLLAESPAVLPAFLFPEAGLSWHPGQTTSLRLGLTGLLPTLRWRHELDPWFWAIDVGSLGYGLYQVRAGRQF